MSKPIGKDYRTILRHLKDLQEADLIKLSRTEKSAKGGKDKNIFTLTESGLLCALDNANIWQDIDKVASNYSDILPLIFGKWDFYTRKGLRNEIITRLQAAVQGFIKSLRREWYRIVRADVDRALKIELEKVTDKEKAETIMTHHRTIAPTLTHKTLGLAPYLDLGKGSRARRKLQRFIGVLIEDPELRQYCDEEFNYWVKESKSEYDRYLESLNWYKQLKASKGLHL